MKATQRKAASDFFKGIYQWPNREYDVGIPIFYYDCSSMTAIYTASTRLVKRHVPADDLHPVEVFPGRCLVTVSAFEYRDSDIGPYNEFSVAVMVRHGKRPLPLLPVLSSMVRQCFHVYILTLPVTSERARRGGVELGGYPKFLAGIEFQKSETVTECRLSIKKNRVVTMRGKTLRTSGFGKIKYVMYTCLNGCLVNSIMHVNPRRFAQSFDKGSAVVEVGGGHPVSDLLSGIQMGEKPLLYQSMPSFEAILCGTENIIDR